MTKTVRIKDTIDTIEGTTLLVDYYDRVWRPNREGDYELVRFREAPSIPVYMAYDLACNVEGSVEEEPAETPEPDWDKAPDWARWWAVDEDGPAYWFEEMPHIDEECNVWHTPIGLLSLDILSAPSAHNWRESLTERPNTLPYWARGQNDTTF